MGQITINKTPSFQEVWREGFVEHEEKKHYFWLIHPQGLDTNGEEYECEIRWFFSRVPREVRALYPQIIEAFKTNIMKTIIHVNAHVIKANRKNGKEDPVLTVKTYKENNYAHEVEILGPSKVVYSPDKPLSCGAHVWIETQGEVIIIK